MDKKGIKWIFNPLFGQKLAEYVLFVKTIIYILGNARQVRRKILNMGGTPHNEKFSALRVH